MIGNRQPCLAIIAILGVALSEGLVYTQDPGQRIVGPSVLAMVRTERGRYVQSITFDPTGEKVAMRSTDGTISIWQAATGKEICIVRGSGPPRTWQTIVFSPDGETVAACDSDGVLCFWEAATGKQRFELGSRTQYGVPSAVFSPNGKTVAATDPGYEGRSRIWEVETGKELAQLHGGPSVVYHLAFAPDGKTLVGTGITKRNFENVPGVHVWDAANGKHLRVVFMQASGDTFASFALSGDGKTFAVGYGGHTLHLWDLAASKHLHELERHGNQVLAVAFSPDGKLLASGCEDGKIRLFEVSTGRTLSTFVSKQCYVCGVAFSPDGKRLVSGGAEPTNSSQLSEAIGSGIVWDLTGLIKGVGEATVALSPNELRSFFVDLTAAEDQRAWRAILALSRAPKQTVPFLKTRVKPAFVPPAEAKQLAQWITELGHAQKAVRDQATAKLESLGQAAEPAMRKAMSGSPSDEARKQLEWLLGELRGLDPTPEMRQARRVAEVLERIGTKEARELLMELAKGSPEAWLTQETKSSLERLTR